MFGLRKFIADAFGVTAVLAFIAVQIAALPAAIYGYMTWSHWGLGSTIGLILIGSALIPFFEIFAFGFAIYGAIHYFEG